MKSRFHPPITLAVGVTHSLVMWMQNKFPYFSNFQLKKSLADALGSFYVPKCTIIIFQYTYDLLLNFLLKKHYNGLNDRCALVMQCLYSLQFIALKLYKKEIHLRKA